MNRKIAQQIVRRLRQNKGGVVLLFGKMGAGKTTLVREMVRLLAPKAQVSSPTYTIIQQYTENIYHADLYRLRETTNPEALAEAVTGTGLFDLIIPGNYVFIEWPEGLDLTGAIRVTINVKEDGNREFIID